MHEDDFGFVPIDEIPDNAVEASFGYLYLIYASFSCLALSLFELVITMDQEIRSIWRRRTSIATVIFIVNRYGSLLGSIADIINLVGPQTMQSCTTSMAIYQSLTIIIQYCIAVFMAIRIWVVWNRSWIACFIVLLLLCVRPTTDAYRAWAHRVIYVKYPFPPPFNACLYETKLSAKTLLRFSTIIPIFALLADVVVLSATWIKTRTIRKDAKCGGTKARLSTLLLRDGSIYFLCHFILNALELALTRAQNASIEAGMFTTLAMKISAVLVCRFILNLRSTATSAYTIDSAMPNTSKITSALSSLRFAASLGGPVDSILPSRGVEDGLEDGINNRVPENEVELDTRSHPRSLSGSSSLSKCRLDMVDEEQSPTWYSYNSCSIYEID